MRRTRYVSTVLSSMLIAMVGSRCSGVGTTPATARVLVSGQTNPIAIAADDTAIYWLNEGTFPDRTDGAVLSRPHQGGEVITLDSGRTRVSELAIDDAFVYWLESTGIRRVSKRGGEPETIAQHEGSARGLALDDHDVYWLERDGIRRAPKSGGTPTRVAPARDPSFLHVDTAHLFWVEAGGGAARISAAPKFGGESRVLYEDTSVALTAVDQTDLYWVRPKTNLGGDVYEVVRAPKSGGAAVPVISTPELSPEQGFLVRELNGYWIAPSSLSYSRGAASPLTVNADGKVFRVELPSKDRGAEPRAVAAGLIRPTALAVTSDALFWATAGALGGGSDGSIMTAALPSLGP